MALKFMKRLLIIRIENTIINLDFLTTAWFDENQSYSGNYIVGYRFHYDESTYNITFKTKKAALDGLDTIMKAIDIPVIEEDS